MRCPMAISAKNSEVIDRGRVLTDRDGTFMVHLDVTVNLGTIAVTKVKIARLANDSPLYELRPLCCQGRALERDGS
jgi:hypothetical protein